MNNLFNHKIIHISYEFTPLNAATLRGKVALHLPANSSEDETQISRISQKILEQQIKFVSPSQTEL
ncbi:MAG TPA: hypothetical protein VIH61_00645, partial [Waddliaceae bacterium]